MKKGFTLIELLAVIVILAIIALIATPIILGIINDAREESNERSVELYAAAVKNAIAAYQLINPNAPASFADLDVQYDGEVECGTKELYKNGSFYITDCTVNGTEVDYTYGRKKYEPQYYSWSSGTIGGDLPSDAKSNLSGIDTFGHPFYLGLDIDSNNKVTSAYLCFTRNETEYCLKGINPETSEINKINEINEINETVLEDGYADVLDDACSFGDEYSFCSDDGWYAEIYLGGDVDASGNGAHCFVYGTGGFECEEWD